jgi:hypothetical protein
VSIFPGLKALCSRELDALACEGVKFPEKASDARGVDVSPSVRFISLKSNSGTSGCVTPTMACYLTHRCRLALGPEALAMQGIHYGKDHYKLAKYTDSDLVDLGGNAFEAIQRTSLVGFEPTLVEPRGV